MTLRGESDLGTQILRVLVGLASLAYVAVFLGLAAKRIPYPFELDWMEGGVLGHVQRILSGKRLYVPPTLDFIPFMYTPAYYYVCAAVSWCCGGASLATLRLVSLIASLGSLTVVFAFVREESESIFAGIMADGLLSATYPLGGTAGDLARVDALFGCLCLMGLYALRFHPTRRGQVVAGILLSLAFLTKQTALVICLSLVIFAVMAYRRRSLGLIVTLAVGIGLVTLLLDRLHDGWFRFYVFDVPTAHPLRPKHVLTFWCTDLFLPLGVAAVMGLLFVAVRLRLADRTQGLFYLFAAIGAVGAAWAVRMHTGGAANVLMPAHALLAILGALGVHAVAGWAQAAPAAWRATLVQISLVAALVQFGALFYDPRALLPEEHDRRAGQALVGMLEALPAGADVLMPTDGYLAVRAGRPMHAHAAAIRDVLMAAPAPASQRLLAEIRTSIAEQRFDAVVLEAPPTGSDRGFAGILNEYRIPFAEYYRMARPIFDDAGVFWHVTGAQVRPAAIWVPRRSDGGTPTQPHAGE